jgi:hypothetical protein
LRKCRRWQAAKRQQKCRSQPGVRQRHAEAERQRRKRRASEAQKPSEEETAAVALKDTPAVNFDAWSRSRRDPQIFCDRPGCYEPLRDSPRAPASYCSDDCRAAKHRARDCERKWLRRKAGGKAWLSNRRRRSRRAAMVMTAWSASRRASHAAESSIQQGITHCTSPATRTKRCSGSNGRRTSTERLK